MCVTTVWKEGASENLYLCNLNMQTVRQSYLSRIDTINCNIKYVKCHASRYIQQCFIGCTQQRYYGLAWKMDNIDMCYYTNKIYANFVSYVIVK